MYVTIFPRTGREHTFQLSEDEFQRFKTERTSFNENGSPKAGMYNTVKSGVVEITFSDVLRFEAHTDAEVEEKKRARAARFQQF